MEKLSLPEIAYQSIIDVIVDGTIKLGQPLSQTELTRVLRMSRTPVREALFALERDGILEKNGRKYSVCYVSKEEVYELYEVRRYLEAITTRLCIENITPEIRHRLILHMKRIRKETFMENYNPYKLAELNGMIHVIIAEGSCNRYLLQFLNETILRLKIVRVAILNSSWRRIEEYDEHNRIVERILDRDIEGAMEAMEIHRKNVIDFTKDKVVNRLFYNEE